jgi:C-terminal processing protease CtpA/Prc
MRYRHRIFSLILTLVCSAASVVAQNAPSALDRDRARTMLNQIRLDLKKNYYDPNFHGMDVDARFKQAEEKINTATSQGQILGIIAQAVLDLNDSHTYFIPPSRPFTVEYGWQMQMIGEKCYIVAIKPGSDAEAKGLKEGDEVYSIDGYAPTRENLWKILYTYFSLRPRPGVRLVVIKSNGQEQQIDVLAKMTEGKRIMNLAGDDLYDLIRQQQNENRLNRHQLLSLGEELSIWKMPAFDLDDPKVDDMISKVKKRKTLILDLRGNGGGYVATLLRMVSNFFDRDIKLGDVQRRKETKPLTAKTRGPNAFTGQLIVLIDSKSGSAAELLARVVQLEKRGIVIGDASLGAVMVSKPYNHEVGIDVVSFYGVSITDADIIMNDGKSLEHVGVKPDQPMLPKPSELAAKLDPVLSYAASLAGVTISPEKAGAMFPVEWRK